MCQRTLGGEKTFLCFLDIPIIGCIPDLGLKNVAFISTNVLRGKLHWAFKKETNILAGNVSSDPFNVEHLSWVFPPISLLHGPFIFIHFHKCGSAVTGNERSLAMSLIIKHTVKAIPWHFIEATKTSPWLLTWCNDGFLSRQQHPAPVWHLTWLKTLGNDVIARWGSHLQLWWKLLVNLV